MPFAKLNSDTKYCSIGIMRDRILGKPYPGGDDILDDMDAFLPYKATMERAYKPKKDTLLHLYIENYLEAEWDYHRYNGEGYFSSDALEFLKMHNIIVDSSYLKDNDYLLNLVIRNLSYESHEIFLELFKERELMRQFSNLVAKIIHNISFEVHPKFLNKNGKIKRCNYWPSWLKNALKNRERNRCAICFCDISNSIAIDKKIHIDHIVPISHGGTNDPTNLQILCDECNFKKGNRSDETNDISHVFWSHP